MNVEVAISGENGGGAMVAEEIWYCEASRSYCVGAKVAMSFEVGGCEGSDCGWWLVVRWFKVIV